MRGGLDKAQTGWRDSISGMCRRWRHKTVAAPRETAYFDGKIARFDP
jgi:hypothetical protein